MAERLVASDVFVEIEGVDVSNLVRSARVMRTRSEVMSAAMGDAWMNRHVGAAKDGSIEIEWITEAAARYYDNIEASFDTGEVTVKVRATATADTVEVEALVTELPFVQAQYAELSTFSTSWPTFGGHSVTVAPPTSPLWHTTLRSGTGGSNRIGFSRNGTNIIGRLTNDDFMSGGDTARIIALEYGEPANEFFIKTSQVQHLVGKWVRIGADDDRIIELSSFSTPTGEGQKTLRPDWDALIDDTLYAVSIWDRDPTGTSWAATTRPHRLWTTTMTVGVSGSRYGYRTGVSGIGSLDDTTISTPDGNLTLARFEWNVNTFDVRMATEGEANFMHDLWFTWGSGASQKAQVSGSTSTVVTLQPTPGNPGWLDSQAVTIEVWDQNPSN